MCWRPPVALSSSNRTITVLGFSNYVACWAINRDPISRKEVQKEKKGKEELQRRTYRAEVKGIEGVVGKEGILRVLERSLIETERWSRSSRPRSSLSLHVNWCVDGDRNERKDRYERRAVAEKREKRTGN